MAYVYWIRHQLHNDILSEGYVGVTTQTVATRVKRHRKSATDGSKYPVHNAMRLYDDLVVEVILQAEEDYCYEVEEKLRPRRRIGWNLAIGGGKSPLSGVPHSEHPHYGKSPSRETRLKISRANSGKRNGMFGKTGHLNSFYGCTHTEETKAKMRLRPWQFAVADKSLWARADELFEIFKSLENKTHSTLGSVSGIPPSKLFTMVKNFNEGWKPTSDMDWLKFKECYGT